MELRTAAACRENRQAGRQNSICCERTRQGSIPSKRPTSSRLLCLLYLLLHKDYRRHGIYGEIRSGTRHNGVQRLQFRCERLASGPTACEERMKKRPCTKHEGDFRAFGKSTPMTLSFAAQKASLRSLAGALLVPSKTLNTISVNYYSALFGATR